MDLRRRFIFRGNASAIGGRIVRPTDIIVDSNPASSLTVAGGRSIARAKATRFGEWVSFGAATTSAEGLFDDVKQQIEFTFGRVPEDALTTSTRVSADVTNLSVGDKPKLTIKHLNGSLSSKSPTGSGEPSIAVHNDTIIEGAAIGGRGLIIELAIPLFQRYDTRSKLLMAADDPEIVKRSGKSLFMSSKVDRAAALITGRLVQSYGTTYATIVKSIKWAGEAYDGAKIDHNVVIVPNFGKIFFGEILITDLSRRLTMLRLELGSPIGGALCSAEVENNGSWSN
jgi:hypothetical protein